MATGAFPLADESGVGVGNGVLVAVGGTSGFGTVCTSGVGVDAGAPYIGKLV